MTDAIRAWLASHKYARLLYPALILATLAAYGSARLSGKGHIFFYIMAAVLLLFIFRPNSILHKLSVAHTSLPKLTLTGIIALLTVYAVVLPMDMLPLWNGEIPGHRNQYELMADAILEGRVEFAYGDEDSLAKLDNPYDPAERKEKKVYYHWDHAYYDGHYYMYFGVAPVFLVFIPFKLLTGQALTTFHATQLFSAAAILGIFLLFELLARLFFKRMSYGVYITLSVAFSVMSLWYATAEPALYCTAITAAIALEVWSIYFFVRAVWGEKSENKQILLAGVGALFGALVFACRPPIALANVAVLPMLLVFLRGRKITVGLVAKLVCAALPYLAVGAGLMYYNYIRFADPFEFGQAYQLTVADQSNYKVTLNLESILRIINEGAANFFEFRDMKTEFPYIRTSSVFFNFPILLFISGLFASRVRKSMKRRALTPLVAGICTAVLVIVAMDILWSPYLLERYRMDIYFLLGILCFITIGVLLNTSRPEARGRLGTFVCAAALLTIVCSYLYCVQTIGNYYPDMIEELADKLKF